MAQPSWHIKLTIVLVPRLLLWKMDFCLDTGTPHSQDEWARLTVKKNIWHQPKSYKGCLSCTYQDSNMQSLKRNHWEIYEHSCHKAFLSIAHSPLHTDHLIQCLTKYSYSKQTLHRSHFLQLDLDADTEPISNLSTQRSWSSYGKVETIKKHHQTFLSKIKRPLGHSV